MTQTTLNPSSLDRGMAAVSDPVPPEDMSEHLVLQRTWQRPPGFLGWLTSTDHKEIGLRYIKTAFFFFALAGILALHMRVQLAVPRNTFLTNDVYNQFFTTHGTAMMFLFAVPVMEGFGLYLVPLMVGTRNVSFPRLLNFSYYLYAIAGLCLFAGLLCNMGPDMGWFAYVPLSGPNYAPGHRMDLWSQMVTCVEISGMAAAIEIITTVLKQRSPGMSLNRIPIFVWAQLVTSFMIIFAMPAVTLCSTVLSMDRLTHLKTHFYNPAEGGDALLWQHLFWFFAHPEVYIVFIPATGFVSDIIVAFSRRRAFGYTALILSMLATAFIGFGVWVHHMFATPLPRIGQGMFTAASLMIVIPNGVQMFCWLATLWSGKKPRMELPLAWVVGFVVVFMIGGLTGVMLASQSLDLQVTDTFFVVAHLHYVLIGGAVFPLFGACYFWYPKWTGRMLNTAAGWWHLVLFFIGFNMTFWPMHDLGLRGMTRRRYTYPIEAGWSQLNMIATIGAFLMGLAVLVFILNALMSRRRGKVAGNNPWQAGTFEWSTTSPPPNYNYLYPPTCQGREPLWENPKESPVITGLSRQKRQVLVTTTLDAAPDHRYDLAGESIWPFLLACSIAATLMFGGIFNPWYAPIFATVVTLVLFGWFWTATKLRMAPSAEASTTGRPPFWWLGQRPINVKEGK
ncbi:MAG TPA: cbb3-type cytochrome c oxidase subunit I [Humisphaera sp.]|jgi:cytochrome c oxidase subunit 1|nr:cbb3-type cytochrome c oxidase subunit I [Humisphaera sp.]